MDFDPDAYLAESGSGDDFDPDAYLGETAAAATQQKGAQFGDDAKFMQSMLMGKGIGEYLPAGVGEYLSDLGTRAGSTAVAAVKAPFSEKDFPELYNEALNANKAAAMRADAMDQETGADNVKTALAGLAVAPMKAPAPVPKIDPFAKPGTFAGKLAEAEKAAAQQASELGKFSYPPDTMREKLGMYLKRKMESVPPGAMSIAKETAQDAALDSIPFSRLLLRLSRRLGSVGPPGSP